MNETQSQVVNRLAQELFQTIEEWNGTVTEFGLRMFLIGWVLDNNIRLVSEKEQA